MIRRQVWPIPWKCWTGGGFEQSYNAQAVVNTESMLILVSHVTQTTNDKEQVEPMVEKMQANPERLNQPEALLVNTGYFSQKNVTACLDAKITPLIAVKRDAHYQEWRERFTDPAPLAADASSVDETSPGRSTYALRKPTVVPVFGIIKSVMGFRQLQLRGLENVRNEWTLMCLAWNFTAIA